MNDLSLSTDFFDQDWLVTVKDHPGYVAAITEIRVNDTVWEKKTYDPSSGGSYRLLEDEEQIAFAKKDFSGGTAAIPVLKSGDVISVTAKGYEMLEFKLVIDADGQGLSGGQRRPGRRLSAVGEAGRLLRGRHRGP